jgi:hypothetical protein
MDGPSARCGLSGGVHPSILHGKLEPSCLIHPHPSPEIHALPCSPSSVDPPPGSFRC